VGDTPYEGIAEKRHCQLYIYVVILYSNAYNTNLPWNRKRKGREGIRSRRRSKPGASSI
jgi:hypothetical protein